MAGIIFLYILYMRENTDFNRLPIDERAAIVWRSGSFVDAVLYYDQTVSLYSVNTDFVEVWTDPRNNRITKISTAQEDQLKKFLYSVNLKNIFRF
jgi:hypothetical protein